LLVWGKNYGARWLRRRQAVSAETGDTGREYDGATGASVTAHACSANRPASNYCQLAGEGSCCLLED
jgi:hypothetical protein